MDRPLVKEKVPGWFLWKPRFKLRSRGCLCVWTWPGTTHFQTHTANAQLTSLDAWGPSNSPRPNRALLRGQPYGEEAADSPSPFPTLHIPSTSISIPSFSQVPGLPSFPNSTLLFLAANIYFLDSCNNPHFSPYSHSCISPLYIPPCSKMRIPDAHLINGLTVIIIRKTTIIKQLIFNKHLAMHCAEYFFISFLLTDPSTWALS